MKEVDIEILSEVFRVIRANSDKTPRQVLRILEKNIPELSRENLASILSKWIISA